MTTIAYRDGVMAADTRVVNGADMINLGEQRKIHEPGEEEYWSVNGDRIICFGLSGSLTDLLAFKELLSEGVTFKTKAPDHLVGDSNLLCVGEQGNVWMVSAYKQRDGSMAFTVSSVQPPFAIGSGSVYASAVMAVGKSAVDAVKAACKLDVYSGGRIETWELPPIPEIPSKRPGPVADKAAE